MSLFRSFNMTLLDLRILHVAFLRLFTSLVLVILSCGNAFCQNKIPAGSFMDYVKGSGSGAVTYPDGTSLNVGLSIYDQWWLSKREEEQGLWLEFWLNQGEDYIEELDSKMTFVQFMTVVMENRLVLRDFGLFLHGDARRETSLPAYAREVAQSRCRNYRSGMSFEEGRIKAAKDVSLKTREKIVDQITLGKQDGEPNVVGMILLAINVSRALEIECPTEVQQAKQLQALGRGWANTGIESLEFGGDHGSETVYVLHRAIITGKSDGQKRLKTCSIVLSLEKHECINSGEVIAWCGTDKVLKNLLTGAVSMRTALVGSGKGWWIGSNESLTPGQSVEIGIDTRNDGLLGFACTGKTMGPLGGITGGLGVGF